MLGSKFFDLQGVALQSYGALLSSSKAVSRTSSRVGQLEDELKVLREEKTREEGVLHRRLKVLSEGHAVHQGRCEAATRRADVAKASLEGMQAERDVAVKEGDILRAGEVERLQAHDRLLDQLAESQHQAEVMEATLGGIRTAEGLEELV
ncbi:hypothetical protein LIER_05429 [Lithospermum erythrorhizon]|uniref:Uncharacterized protein n=1 Tax=Lithospermum erythrorhizon TaxID=34254 RepID=A0AAV3P382_LITER